MHRHAYACCSFKTEVRSGSRVNKGSGGKRTLSVLWASAVGLTSP